MERENSSILFAFAINKKVYEELDSTTRLKRRNELLEKQYQP